MDKIVYSNCKVKLYVPLASAEGIEALDDNLINELIDKYNLKKE